MKLTLDMGEPGSMVVEKIMGIVSFASLSFNGTVTRGARFSSGRRPCSVVSIGDTLDGISIPEISSSGRFLSACGCSRLRNLSAGTNGRSSTPGLSGTTSKVPIVVC